jgi:hypothetical protein
VRGLRRSRVQHRRDQRAAQGSYRIVGDEPLAYQLGFRVGTNLGLTTNRSSPRKTHGRRRAYWQSVQLNSSIRTSPIRISSKGRTNIEGVFMAFAYAPTDSIIGTVRLGLAHRANADAPTPGSNPDIPQVQPLTQFKILSSI